MTNHTPHRSQLQALVPKLPPADIDEAMRRGRQVEGRRRWMTGAGVIVAAATVAAFALHSGMERSAIPAAPTTSGPTSDPSGPSVVCPSPVATPGVNDGMPSYISGVYWGSGYMENSGQLTGEPGKVAGVVPCNIAEIQDAAQARWLGAWPQGSSTDLRVGTTLHWDSSRPDGCALMAQRDGAWVVYLKPGC